MLQRRLTGQLLAGLLLVTVAACGDEPIEDNLVRPGITAIDESRDLACGADANTMRTAIDAYSMLVGDPPSDEQALIDEGYLREASEAWDVADGVLVAQDPACGAVGESATDPTVVDIVTDAQPLTAEQVFAEMTDEQIEQVGGTACARELAEIFAAGEQFVAERSTDPASFDDLVDAGYLDGPPELWGMGDDRLVPVDGGGCIDLG